MSNLDRKIGIIIIKIYRRMTQIEKDSIIIQIEKIQKNYIDRKKIEKLHRQKKTEELYR